MNLHSEYPTQQLLHQMPIKYNKHKLINHKHKLINLKKSQKKRKRKEISLITT
jgi:hypothetical protein